MINCPNCGNPVREDVKFCGNCGIDVQAALAAAQQATAAAEPQPSPYAYPQQTSAYGGFDLRRDIEQTPVGPRLLIVGILILAVCCAFVCGALFVAAIFELAPSPAPKPTPTKESLYFFQTILRLPI